MMIELITNGMQGLVKVKKENINKYGFKKVRFSIDDPLGSEEKDLLV